MAGNGEGYGKIILFGEHFVVYGLPAIASAIGDVTLAEIVKGPEITTYSLIDNRPATDGYKIKKQGEMERSMKLLLDFMKLDVVNEPVQITLSGNLFCTSGIGASAAMATSIARAFSNLYSLGLDDDQINRISYEAEKGSAGTPSGIDNTCATYGGLLWFVKNLQGGKNVMAPIRADVQGKLLVVLGSTGISQETKEVVEDVRRQKIENEEKFRLLFESYGRLVEDARAALKASDVGKIAELMNDNHRLLKDMNLSCDEIEEIISEGRRAGAVGAKVTGTGRGGYVILLVRTPEDQDFVAAAIEKKGYRAMKTVIEIV